MSDAPVIVGAHTLVGRSLRERLADRDITDVVAATTSEFVDTNLVLLDERVLQQGGLFVLAMNGELPRKVAAALASQGRIVIDVADAFDEGPYLWTSLVSTSPSSGLQRVAVGPAGPLVSALRALSVFRPRAVRVTTLESAATAGQAGLDELSEHTRSVFAMRDVEPAAFAASIAFDPMPSVGRAGVDPLTLDARLVEQMQDGLRLIDGPTPDIVATRVLVPSFVADAAVLVVETEDPDPELATVVDTLSSGRGLRCIDRAVLPALDAVDRDDTLVSRVRVGPHRIDLWLAYDRTRAASAVPAALAVDAWRRAAAK